MNTQWKEKCQFYAGRALNTSYECSCILVVG